jgi:hypothetical protein
MDVCCLPFDHLLLTGWSTGWVVPAAGMCLQQVWGLTGLAIALQQEAHHSGCGHSLDSTMCGAPRTDGRCWFVNGMTEVGLCVRHPVHVCMAAASAWEMSP